MIKSRNIEENILYCICPKCGTARRRVGKKYTIIKKGKERNGIARFLCINCNKWFNEKTGDIMQWQSRF